MYQSHFYFIFSTILNSKKWFVTFGAKKTQGVGKPSQPHNILLFSPNATCHYINLIKIHSFMATPKIQFLTLLILIKLSNEMGLSPEAARHLSFQT